VWYMEFMDAQTAARFDARPPRIPVLKVKSSPPLIVQIPENSRYENTPMHRLYGHKLKLSKLSFIYQLVINASSIQSTDNSL